VRATALIGVLCLAAPAFAQQGGAGAAPEEVARFALETCVRETPPEAMPPTGDFERVSEQQGSATFAHPAGPVLTLARRDDVWSCRIEVPGAGQAWFDAAIRIVSPAMGERFDTEDFEQVEDGLVWDLVTPAGTALTTELRLREDGTVVFTSETAPSDPPNPDPQEE
jgi:hypothetical protein